MFTAEGDECTIDNDCQFENAVCNSSYVCAYNETDNSTDTTRLLVTDDQLYQLYSEDEEVSRIARSLSRSECYCQQFFKVKSNIASN